MKILADFDFAALNSPEFKEDSVREEIIQPILRELGYRATGNLKIVRSRALTHPYVKLGSKKYKINHFPDYLLEMNGKPHFVLDAKGPNENITTGDNVAQVFFYAIHPDIRTSYYGLCNGKLFTVFDLYDQKPILNINVYDINERIDELAAYLLPTGETQQLIKKPLSSFNHLLATPPLEILNIKKQAAKRHFGVHGYFTKQSWEVVQAYIDRFTQRGDLVLDPFGGTGVTAVEAMVLGRRAIHVDLNPLSIFWVRTVLQRVNIVEFAAAAVRVLEEFTNSRPQTDEDITQILLRQPLPPDLPLPKGSDVSSVHQLFTKRQLAELAFLKSIIENENDLEIRDLLLLAFSGATTKMNLTYHPSKGRSDGRGDSGIFRYYRYRVATNPAYLDLAEVFVLRYKKIVAAERELQTLIEADTINQSQIVKGNATDLKFIGAESVDYIYTDPPYGKKIPYLDLSTMWNAWLNLDVTEEDYKNEAIEGGSRNKTKTEYSNLITLSIQEMFRVLKWDRWMSFVFQHQDPRYWHLIVETAQQIGFEYMGAVSQNNGQTSFKKRQNYFTVLSGQMIINFRKVRNPKTLLKGQLGMDVTEAIYNNIEAVIAKRTGATLEEIYNELVIHGLELGYLDILSKEYSDLTPLLREHFEFNNETGKYYLPANKKFKSHIPLELRVRYFLTSFLRRRERENNLPTFDEIVYNIMPLLKNGITPANQDILSVLENIAEHQGSDRWRLRGDNGQGMLF